MDSDYESINQHLVKYGELNATHALFGGKMLQWMDEAAALFASEKMLVPRIVTRHMGSVDFSTPVEKGRIVRLCGKVIKEGRTSLTVRIKVSKLGMGESPDRRIPITETDFVLVSIDEWGKPTPWRAA